MTADRADGTYRLNPRTLELGLVLVWAVAYFTARNLLERGIGTGFIGVCAVSAIAVVLCCGFYRVTYDHLDSVMRRLTQATALGVLIYQIAEPPDLTLANPQAASLHAFVTWTWVPALAAAVLSLRRPAFLALPALHILITREVTEEISGFRISFLDIFYLVDMSMLLAASACVLAVCHPLLSWQRLRGVSLAHLSQACAFVAIGVHLGNYFWSGVAKVTIGPEWTYWILENKTQNTMLPGLAIGIVPYSGNTAVVQSVHATVSALHQWLNAGVVAIQLFAILALLRLVALRLATVAYDIMHISIYLMLGAFFWPWVWNNLSILYAIGGKRDAEINWVSRTACILVILSGMYVELARSSPLAWFDTPLMKLSQVQVRTGETSPWIDVPVSFFLGHSYSMGHGVFSYGLEEGHYRPGARGSSVDRELHEIAETCPAPPLLTETETADQRAERQRQISAFLRAHHQKMLDRNETLPHNWFYWRAHHFPSNPMEYKGFNGIELSAVTAYRVLTRSICMGVEEGNLISRVQFKSEFVIQLPPG